METLVSCMIPIGFEYFNFWGCDSLLLKKFIIFKILRCLHQTNRKQVIIRTLTPKNKPSFSGGFNVMCA